MVTISSLITKLCFTPADSPNLKITLYNAFMLVLIMPFGYKERHGKEDLRILPYLGWDR